MTLGLISALGSCICLYFSYKWAKLQYAFWLFYVIFLIDFLFQYDILQHWDKFFIRVIFVIIMSCVAYDILSIQKMIERLKKDIEDNYN